MVRTTNIGVHVVLLQQFERLLYVSRMVEQQSNSRGGGDIWLCGIHLIGAFVIPRHQVSHYQPFLIDAVHRHIYSGSRFVLIDDAIHRVVSIAET